MNGVGSGALFVGWSPTSRFLLVRNAVAGDDSAEGARHGLKGNRVIDQRPERVEGGGPHCRTQIAPSWGDGT